MSLKNFRNRQHDRKLLPRLFLLSYALMILGLIFYSYVLCCQQVPSGKILYHPHWEILKGGSCSCDFDHFTLSDKEVAQLLIIAPFFIAIGSCLKLLGLKRQ